MVAKPSAPPDSVSGQGAARLGEVLQEQGAVTPGQLETALGEQQHLKEVAQKQAESADSSIMIAAANLDRLVDLVGDLITMQTRLSMLTATNNDHETVAIVRGIEQQTHRIRNTTMHIRKMTISTILSRYRRVVGEEAELAGKEVELITEGGDIELDKTLVERLDEPLAEMLRFCVAIDQESPSQRERDGKSRRGAVKVTASYGGGQVRITVASDGSGLGSLLPPGTATTTGIHDLSFLLLDGAPVEAQALVGIKRTIAAMRGTVEITGNPGIGLAIDVVVPLSLAVIEGLLVMIGGQNFIIPLFAIKECVERPRRAGDDDAATGLVLVRGEMIPFVSLRHLLNISECRPEVEHVIVSLIDRQKIGFVVDHVVGEIQTVVKPLGRFLKQVDWCQGAAILGDGNIALILDMAELSAASSALGADAAGVDAAPDPGRE